MANFDGRNVPLAGVNSISLPLAGTEIGFEFSPQPGLRERWRLDGVDQAWHEGATVMCIHVRFADADGQEIGHTDFPLAGESPGWTGDLRSPVFERRRESVAVPPGAASLWIEITSAGAPETVGALLVTNISLFRTSKNGEPEVMLTGPPGGVQDTPFSGALEPATFMRDGPRPNMARMLTIRSPRSAPPSQCLCIVDNDPQTHAEWHTIKGQGPRVYPGEALTLTWDEAYSIGQGNALWKIWRRPPRGDYRLRWQKLDVLGRPLAPESSLWIHVLPPWWQQRWVWAAALALAMAATVSLTRYVVHRRAQRQLAVLQQERLLEQERMRIAREIHDTLAQGLTGVIVQLEAAEGAQAKGCPERSMDHLERARELARDSLQEARRSVHALRPQILEEKELPAALGDLLDRMTFGTDLRAELLLEGTPRRLGPEIECNLLRVGQEALVNVLRHARAFRFTARLAFAATGVHLELKDDGRGFVPETSHDGFGLTGMKERIESLGGRFSIRSEPGAGSTIAIDVATPRGG